VTASTVLANAVILLPLEGMLLLMFYILRGCVDLSIPSLLSLDGNYHVPKLGGVQAAGTGGLPAYSHRLPSPDSLHSCCSIGFCVSLTEIVPTTDFS